MKDLKISKIAFVGWLAAALLAAQFVLRAPAATPLPSNSPSGVYRAVMPSDTVDFPDGPCRGLFVGSSGDVAVIGSGDSDAITFPSLAAGYHPLSVKRVKSTGTTASNIIALY